MKNFLFDLYGTLVDIRTDEGNEQFRARFLKRCGKAFGAADFFKEYIALTSAAVDKNPLREPDVLQIFIEIARMGGVALSKEEAAETARAFRALSRSRLRLYPHVKETLSALRSAGARLYIVSNAQRCFTMDEIIRLGLDKAVDGVELSSDFGYKKPSAEFFAYALTKYSIEAADAVYVGNDIKADVLGAKGAGLKTAYIYTPISPAEDSLATAAASADYAVKTHAELKRLLLSLAHKNF